MVFLVVVLVVLALIGIWTFDLHKIFYVKSLSQNAGDSAALAAARWQGISLNLVGDMNIMQAVAIMNDDTNAAASIQELQARILFVGPMLAFVGSQQAAKNNRVYANEEFTDAIREHAYTVQNVYPFMLGADGNPLFIEPWDGAWIEYGDMLYAIAEQGIAAAPDNARFYIDYDNYDHMLLNQQFYDAVFGRLWCWFYHNAYDVLRNYNNYTWWPPLPPMTPDTAPINSEFFGLGLDQISIMDDLQTVETINTLREERELSNVEIDDTVTTISATWYTYDASIWSAWDVMTGSSTSAPALPLTGTLKPQYDYAGADAVARIETESSRLAPGADSHPITWSAAAKPFGYLNDTERPDAYQLVLPAYHDVRLIPLAAASGGSGGAFNLLWRIHITEHLPAYENSGLGGLSPTCWYCHQLRTWEDYEFRSSGITWLSNSSNSCFSVGGGGGGGGGGGSGGGGGGVIIAH